MSIKSWLAFLVFGSTLGLLLFLGFWQLNRAEEKQALIKIRLEREQGPVLRLDKNFLDGDNLRDHKVVVSGVYDAQHQFLLDNQIIAGRIGVYVMTPLRITGSSRAVLVNRGWVPISGRRRVESNIGIDELHVKLVGSVKNFPAVGYKLDGAEIPTPGWPSMIQVVDEVRLSKILGYELLPYQLLLSADAEQGFDRRWPESYPMSPEKHIGYAVQWFLLAFTLVVLVIWRSKKSDRKAGE